MCGISAPVCKLTACIFGKITSLLHPVPGLYSQGPSLSSYAFHTITSAALHLLVWYKICPKQICCFGFFVMSVMLLTLFHSC